MAVIIDHHINSLSTQISIQVCTTKVQVLWPKIQDMVQEEPFQPQLLKTMDNIMAQQTIMQDQTIDRV